MKQKGLGRGLDAIFGSEKLTVKAEALQAAVAEKYPECDVELHYGGQPIYYYYIALE